MMIPSRLRFLYVATDELLHNYKNLYARQRQFIEFCELQMEAINVYRMVFSKYRNVNIGKEIAVIGSGPTQ